MLVLLIALLTSLMLSLLLASAVLARTGLRGRLDVLPLGLGIGVLAGLPELWMAPEANPLLAWLDFLPAQILAGAGLRAMLYGLLVGAAITLMLGRLRQAKRRADVLGIAVAVGFGFGASTTFAELRTLDAWPPGLLIVAMTNMPMQVCFAMLIASPILRSRLAGKARQGQSGKPGQHLPIVTSYLLALLVQAAFQAVLRTNALIGHWLAWIEPLWLGAIWLGLIMLVGLAGFAVMLVQEHADLPQAFLDKLRAGGSLMLSPLFWGAVGSVIVGLTGLFLALSFSAGVETMLGRVMIYALLGVPLMSSAIILRTAMALRRSPNADETGG